MEYQKLEKATKTIIPTLFQFITSITLQTLQVITYIDKSIKKGSIVIQNHSINIRNKEYCKWIDDSYFWLQSHIISKVNFGGRKPLILLKEMEKN